MIINFNKCLIACGLILLPTLLCAGETDLSENQPSESLPEAKQEQKIPEQKVAEKNGTAYIFKLTNLHAIKNEDKAIGRAYQWPHIVVVVNSFNRCLGICIPVARLFFQIKSILLFRFSQECIIVINKTLC